MGLTLLFIETANIGIRVSSSCVHDEAVIIDVNIRCSIDIEYRLVPTS